jgi:hypothetical protein
VEEQNPVEEPVHEQDQVSTTDPDSTYATKGGTPARLGYYDNYLVDNDSCVIVGVQATAARMSQETVAAQDMLTRFVQRQGREPASIAADATYGNKLDVKGTQSLGFSEISCMLAAFITSPFGGALLGLESAHAGVDYVWTLFPTLIASSFATVTFVLLNGSFFQVMYQFADYQPRLLHLLLAVPLGLIEIRHRGRLLFRKKG